MTDKTIDRRTAIADAAVALVAESGARGLSHRAIDRRLELPDGSVSYYFRTREALISAAIEAITRRAHGTFVAMADLVDDPADAATTIGNYLDDLIRERGADIAARYALLTEVARHPDQLRALRDCLFSVSAAQALMSALGSSAPSRDAADLLSLCEGLVFDHITGRRSSDHRLLDLTRSAQGFLNRIDH